MLNVPLSRCIVLTPFQDAIRHETEECLRGVERLGVAVRRDSGCSAIDFARCEIATWAYRQGYESMLFVDSDMGFDPKDALYMLQREGPVVGGLYAQKHFNRKVNCNLIGDPAEIPCGTLGVDLPAKGIGAGFLRIRREALEILIDRLGLPLCTDHGGELYPFFLPMVVETETGWGYRGEDYAFCERCHLAGIPVVMDTRPRLYHTGTYHFGWEDAVREETQRQEGFTIPYRRIP